MQLRLPAAVAALLLLGACAPPGLEGRLLDLTHPFDAETIYWPTEEEGFVLETVAAGNEPGYWYAASRFRTAEHGGTHLDAPYHFAEGGDTAEAIPLERLVAPGFVIDASADDDPNREVEFDGPIPRGTIVLIRTGHGRHYPWRDRYLGTAETGPAAIPHLRFPGLSAELALRLVEAEVAAVGIDTASIDRGSSKRFDAHRHLADAGIPVFENVANLEALPESGFTVVALPMKIRGGTGGPVRIIAILP